MRIYGYIPNQSSVYTENSALPFIQHFTFSGVSLLNNATYSTLWNVDRSS